jgi:hypothetical protein
MPRVPANISDIAVMKATLRPNWSPIFPKSIAPRGLNKKPIAKAAKEASNDAIGSAEGKKILATVPARSAYV